MDDYALAAAKWLENRVRLQEKKFPQLIVLKAEVIAATEAVTIARTNEATAFALARQDRASTALISSLPM
jgi:hypothetical protein